MEQRGVREAVICFWDVVNLGREMSLRSWADGEPKVRGQLSRVFEVRSWVAYGCERPSTRRRTPMDVDAMVQRWVPIIRGLSTAHSKDELDRCEFEMETDLGPLLAAPVKQLREFYSSLVSVLKGDPKIPLFVWSAFDAWHEVIVKKAPDGAVLELKKELAQEVADLVEADVRPDIGKAIAGALQWRSPEQLTTVRDAVRRGAKPRLVGKESCLFLVVPDGQGGESQVML